MITSPEKDYFKIKLTNKWRYIKMNKQMLSFLSLILVISLVIIGCGNAGQDASSGKSEQQPEEKDSKELVIALVPKATTSEWFLPAKDGVDKALKEFGKPYKLLYVSGSSETDVAGQIKTIEDLISRKVDGIIISCTDGKALAPEIDKAVEEGIPVVAFDSDAPDSKRIAYYGTNNIDTGFSAGKAMAEMIDGKGKVAVVMGVLGASNEMDRLEGFKKALKEYPDIEIVNVIDTQGDRAKAAEAAANLMSSNPDIVGIFGNTGIAAPGMAQGVVEAGYAGKVKLVGMDDVPDNIRFLKEDVMNAIVVQSPYDMGYNSAKALLDFFETGEAPKEAMNFVPAKIMTKDDF